MSRRPGWPETRATAAANRAGESTRWQVWRAGPNTKLLPVAGGGEAGGRSLQHGRLRSFPGLGLAYLRHGGVAEPEPRREWPSAPSASTSAAPPSTFLPENLQITSGGAHLQPLSISAAGPFTSPSSEASFIFRKLDPDASAGRGHRSCSCSSLHQSG